jgi:hypothetical protein
MKPRELIISDGEIDPEKISYSGIQITYIKSRDVLQISGWYDSYVGIEGIEMTVTDFIAKLGIKPRILKGGK